MNLQDNIQNDLQQLLDRCYNAFGVATDADTYISPRRKTLAKHAFCKMARQRFDGFVTLYELASFLQYRSHASIIAGERVAQNLIDVRDRLFMTGWRELQRSYEEVKEAA